MLFRSKGVLLQIRSMPKAVRTAGEFMPDLRKGLYKFNSDPLPGYFDQNLKDALQDALGLRPRITHITPPIDRFIPGVGFA